MPLTSDEQKQFMLGLVASFAAGLLVQLLISVARTPPKEV